MALGTVDDQPATIETVPAGKRTEKFMGSLMKTNKNVARKKGTLAAVTAVGGVALLASGAWVLGAPVVAVGAWLGYDWFMFRARYGMRF
jgi:hypothetical protein